MRFSSFFIIVESIRWPILWLSFWKH